MHRRVLLATAAAMLALATGFSGSAALAADTYPEKPVTIVVPFPPGGSTDLLARKLGESIGEQLGQPVVVENRGGAGGTVGANYVASSDADGYTLLMGVTGSNAISAALRDDLPYNPVTDFDPVSIVISSPLALVVNADSDFKSVQDVLTYATENPDTFTHGTPGVGTSMHMAGELFGLKSGTKLVHVPYKGSAAALQDLLGGRIDAMFGDILVTSEYINSGRLTALGVTGTQEHFLLEDVPTIAEAGLPDYAAFSWQGVFAPAGTPPENLAKLYDAISTALGSDDLQSLFRERGFLVEGMTPADSKAFIASEVEKWTAVVDAAGLKK
ncbi:Argininosuccinate lyase [Thalassovita gelatinovora]|uniref:Argininosuccinate lyase n=1 Tax=Thalassovita gelatinovora TaxID=53501 RepID=A0A0P1FUH5_THAGE|nr:tripartite tricarboxylate transporter substrate binding protein [Thalassovita gelatinovora]QIZ79160.1 tripartite tricarboxylate transporter substrate binding protein [Thalassovita gelatinovora]CUH63614.1 Argininosuccinate lyase [Thalassovita gelatinovora]SER00524.1 Tripartite-type tricarboxylate transporter, receptor component TctC [Thalassovita gelatinovora]